jgi:hypothetical protein
LRRVPGCRNLCRSFCIGGCLLRQKNHLPATAAPREVSENLFALRRGKRLLG